MKKYLIIIVIACTATLEVFAQEQSDNSAIKLFLSPAKIAADNSGLPDPDRLYRKMIQLVNQTGIVEVGYSTFLIVPKLDVESISSSNAGVERVFLAECNLSVLVKRTKREEGNSEAIFNSRSWRITGSGSTKEEAISNALNNISNIDKKVVDFFSDVKQKITDYFKTNCNLVIKEAERAINMKNYQEAIALYYSVPSNAPCYNAAVDASQKVYATAVKDECEKSLLKLKSYVALAQSQNTEKANYYTMALDVMKDMSPASDKCFAEAKLEIEKIEKRLAGEEKNKWEFLKKYYADEVQVKKEMYKAMQKINSSYQPAGGGTNIIIAH
jgi:hypothetical protein